MTDPLLAEEACKAWEQIAHAALERAYRAEEQGRRNRAALLRYMAWECVAEADLRSPNYGRIDAIWYRTGSLWSERYSDFYSRAARLLSRWADAVDGGRL